MKTKPPIAFHHLAAALVPADAVGNCAVMMDEIVQENGHPTFLYAPLRAGGFTKSAGPMSRLPGRVRAGDVVVYHHSTGSDAAEVFLGMEEAQRVLVYHNITPPLLLDREGEAFAASARGLAQLPVLSRAADLCLAFSKFSARDLRQAHAPIKIVPMPLSEKWCSALHAGASKRANPHRSAKEELRLLHVGRVVPSKRLEIAIRAAEWLARDEGKASVSLTLAGDTRADAAYVQHLVAYARQHPSVRLRMTGSLSREALAEEYLSAHLYICPSAHEGFCVPLIESMFAELPVVASASGAIPETLAGAGIVLQDPSPEHFAEAARRILDDAELSEKLRTSQRHVRQRYTIQAFKREWAQIIAGLVGHHKKLEE